MLVAVGDDLAAILELGGPYDEFELEAGTHEVRRPIVLSYPLTLRGLGGGAVLCGAPEGPLLVVQHFAVPPGADEDDDLDDHEIGIEIEISDVAFVHAREEGGTDGFDVVRVEAGKVRFAGCRFANGRLGAKREHGAGLRARANAIVTLKACVAEDNEQAGLLVEDEARSEVEGCVFRRNGVGATFSGRAAGLVRGCTAEGNVRFGFMVTDQAKPTLVENRIHRNGAPGVAVVDEARPLVVDNKLDAADMADPADEHGSLPPDHDLRNPENVLVLLGVPPLTLEVGESLIALVDPGLGGELMDLVVPLRVDFGLRLGFVVPGIQFKDNLNLAKTEFRILVKDVPAFSMSFLADHRLALAVDATDLDAPFTRINLPTEPGARASCWVPDGEVARAEAAGWELSSSPKIVLRCLERVLDEHAWSILAREEVRIMLDKTREKAPAVLRELLPDRMDLGTIHQVLQNLLREGVAIRDLVTICEALHDACVQTGEPGALAEAVRKRLTRRIGEDLSDDQGRLLGVTLAPDTERHVAEELARLTEDLHLPAREALRRRAALEALLLEELAPAGHAAHPILLVSPALRPRLAAFLVRHGRPLHVLATDELHPAYPFVDLSMGAPG